MDYGNKGNMLLDIKNMEVRIPAFTVLGKAFFEQFLQSMHLYETAQMTRLQTTRLRSDFASIRKKILETPLSREIKEQITQAVKDLRFPLAVRSSASIEDGARHASAGLFDTLLHVNEEALFPAVQQVMASLFDEKCILLLPGQDFHPEGYFMGIIFQEMVDAQWSGVAFSADPSTGDAGSVLVELAEGLGDNVVSGLCETQSFRIPKDGDSSALLQGYSFLNTLKNQVLQLSAYTKMPVDVEWAYLKNQLYILQVRPITTIPPKPVIERIQSFSMSELNHSVYPYLGYLQKRYPKWLKKARLFAFCEAQNIKTVGWKFIVFSQALLASMDVQSILSGYQSEYIACHLSSHSPQNMHQSKLIEVLKEFSDLNSEHSYCVSIRECLPNEKCAISFMRQDGCMTIESIFGEMRHLNTGEVLPTQYILDAQGNILREQVEEQFISVFDSEQACSISTDQKKKNILSPSIISEIYEKTREISAHFGACTVEWWLFGEVLYCADMSILKENEGGGQGGQCCIISKGRAEGKIYKIPKTYHDALLSMNKFCNISVAGSELELSKIEVFKALEKQFMDWKMQGNVLLYSDKPYIFLAPLIPYVDGFIFKHASSLCHLSLILREVSLPALSLEHTEFVFCEQKHVILDAEEGVIRSL